MRITSENKWLHRMVALALLAVLVIPTIVSNVVCAATTLTLLDGALTITDSIGTGSESNGTVTITATGGSLSKTTNTITLVNESDSTATLSFDYSVSNADSHTLPATSGTYTVVLDAGASTSFSITSKRFKGTVTLELSNISLTPAAASSNVAFDFDSALGSVTVDGTTVSDGNVLQIPLSGAALVATPKSGATFLGWVNAANNSVLSTATSYTLTPTGDMTVKAAFAGTGAKGWFQVGTNLYDDLNVAATVANSGTNKTIILAANGTLPAGDYTIPSGVTLLIPFNASHTLCANRPEEAGENKYTVPTVFRKLTMADGANIVVEGAISISGQTSSAMNPTGYGGGKVGANGAPSGPLGFIEMANGSSITVKNNANLYCWGYIIGSGSVEVLSGGTVYENFQLTDWRGGTVATENMLGNEQRVFPMSQYYIQNIQVPLKLYAGAKEKVVSAFRISILGLQWIEPTFIGSDGLFNMTSGYLIKDYDEETDHTVFRLNGDASISSMSMKVSFYTLNSSEYVMPIRSGMLLEIQSGNVTVGQDLLIQPGAEIIIGKDAKVTLNTGTALYVYDSEDWGKFCYFNSQDRTYNPVAYVPTGRADRSAGLQKDGRVVINGTVDASAGSIYTTVNGADITSDGNGTIVVGSNSETKTYQFSQVDTATDGDTYGAKAFVPITITSAQLKHGDGTYLTSGTNTYTYTNGRWVCGTHTPGAAATCTTAQTCTVCNTVLVAAKGHSWKNATCTAPKTCTVCGATEGTATSHSYTSAVTKAPTCTEKGVKTYTCSGCGNSYTEEIAATGHTEETIAGKAATCTETGLTDGKKCTICGEVTVAQEEVAALGHSYTSTVTKEPTCTEKGVKTYTCSGCGNSYTEEIDAIGHTYKESSYICDVCGLFEFKASNVRLGNSLDMLFAFPMIDDTMDWDGCYVKIVRDGEEDITIPSNQWSVSGEYYYVTYSGFAAKEMWETVTVTVHKQNGTAVSTSWEDGIQKYAMRMLEKHPTNTSLRTLLVDMLNYGAACQEFFANTENYTYDCLANAQLSDEQKGYATQATPECSDEYAANREATSNGFWGGSAVMANSDSQFVIGFKNFTEGMYFTYEFTNHWEKPVSRTITYAEMTSKGVYHGLANLRIADARIAITITVYGADGTQLGTWQDSIEAYVYRKKDEGDVYMALLKFADAAHAYLHSNEVVT